MNSVERVKKLCKENKIPISKLERDLGFSNGYIGQLKKGVFPDDRLTKIADYFGVSTNFLMTGKEPSITELIYEIIDSGALDKYTKNKSTEEADYLIDKSNNKLKYNINWDLNLPLKSPHPYIPILGKVIAGVPVEAVEDIIGKIQINEKLAKNGNFYALEVKGDSMQPRLQEGDIVVVKEQADVESGQIAIICVNGDEYTIKKIKKSEIGITLIPFNPAYEPIFTLMKK